MIRFLDLFFAFFGLVFLFPLIIFLYLLIFLENNSPLFCQVRVGRDLKKFTLIKFRTMKIGTESCATHLVDSTKITKLGKILRKTKLDEIPQLLNVLKGEMSFVGPRPCLPNQVHLIETRKEYNLYRYTPGITGLSQIKGIDMSNPVLLSKTDDKMMKNLSLLNYFYYIGLTLLGSGFGDKVRKPKNFNG